MHRKVRFDSQNKFRHDFTFGCETNPIYNLMFLKMLGEILQRKIKEANKRLG